MKELLNYCRWNLADKVEMLLANNSDLDVLGEGGYFGLAVKHNNVAMLNTLLRHYEKTKLQGNQESIEHKLAVHKLSNVFEEIVRRSSDISPEIQKIISPYMPTDEDSDDDLSGFGDLSDQWDEEEDGELSSGGASEETEDFGPSPEMPLSGGLPAEEIE